MLVWPNIPKRAITREKRVFAIELSDRYGRATRKEIFFKSAGWGWLGYHAYIAGRRLDGFVPELIGLRNGLLVTAWIDETDFEHHNFGGAELDIADPAYDLAPAVFEFQWNRESEEQLLATYMRMSGDRTAADRMIIYKILYASMAMRHAEGRVLTGNSSRLHSGHLIQKLLEVADRRPSIKASPFP